MLQYANSPGDQLLAAKGDAIVIPDRRLVSLFSCIRRNWWLPLSGGLVFFGFGVAASVFLPASYAAFAEIVVDPVDLNLLQNELTRRGLPSDAGVAITETQVKVIGSDNVLRRVVEVLRLDQDREFYRRPSWRDGGVTEAVMIDLGAAAPKADADPKLVALEALRHAVIVRRTERTYVIDIVVKTEEPEKAALIANAITDSYLAERSAARLDVARRASGELEARLDELRSNVRAAEARLVPFREQNNLFYANGRTVTEQQVNELTSQLSAANARVSEARSRLAVAAALRRGGDTSSPEVVQSPDVRALRQQLSDLSRNEADLAARLGRNHPSIAQARAQTASVRRSLSAETERVAVVNGEEYHRAVAAVQAITRQLAELKATLATSGMALVTLHELERDAESRRSVYEAFLRRARETGEEDRLNTTNARVISAAVPARKRSFPPSPFLLLPGSLIIGLVVGAAIAVLRNVPGQFDWQTSALERLRPGEDT